MGSFPGELCTEITGQFGCGPGAPRRWSSALQPWSKQVDVQQTHSRGSEVVMQDQILAEI